MHTESRCPDCHVQTGTEHRPDCDVARCRVTGMQLVTCVLNSDHRCASDVWSGRWPGQAEAEAFGWWARLVPGRGWVTCSPDDPGAHPDLNRLYRDADWDPAAGTWRRRPGR